jgi:2-haloacid dehalogenase
MAADIKALLFDVFGTVVDWRNGVAREVEPFLRRHALDVDAFNFADEWRALYAPAMDEVRSGRRQFVRLPKRFHLRNSMNSILAGIDLTHGRTPSMGCCD